MGWRVGSSMRMDFVLDALEQALYTRQPERDRSLVAHSDRGSRYVSIRFSERLPWKTKEFSELPTLEWVSWFHTRRLLEPIGHIPPPEVEANYDRQLAEQAAMQA